MVVISTVVTTLLITDRMKAKVNILLIMAYKSLLFILLYKLISNKQTNKQNQSKTEQNNNNQNISVDCYGTDIIHTKHYILDIFDKIYVICRSKTALGNILGNI